MCSAGNIQGHRRPRWSPITTHKHIRSRSYSEACAGVFELWSGNVVRGARTKPDKKELLFRFEMFNKNALATDACRTRPTVTNKTLAGALEAGINVAGGCNCTWGDELDRRLQSLMAKLDPCLWRNSQHLLPPLFPRNQINKSHLSSKTCSALLAEGREPWWHRTGWSHAQDFRETAKHREMHPVH